MSSTTWVDNPWISLLTVQEAREGMGRSSLWVYNAVGSALEKAQRWQQILDLLAGEGAKLLMLLHFCSKKKDSISRLWLKSTGHPKDPTAKRKINKNRCPCPAFSNCDL